MKSLSIRSFVFAASVMTLAASANALTIPTNATVSDSVLAFSPEAISLFQSSNGKVVPLGNATAVEGKTWTYSLPITSVAIGPTLKIENGKAVGSALVIQRTEYDDNDVAIKRSITLANFTIDYKAKQVLADLTPLGGRTQRQAPVYNFVNDVPLAFKYRFPLTITLHEVLGQLVLTDSAVEQLVGSLNLSGADVLKLVRESKFGTLTNDVRLNLRKKAVPTKPYEVTP